MTSIPRRSPPMTGPWHGLGHCGPIRSGTRILLGLQDTPGAPVKASDILLLAQIGLSARPVRDVLAEAGMLDDDRVPAIEAWFTRAITGLPDPMASELRAWFEVMLRGSTQPPRSRPRRPRTVEAKLRWALPALRAWAAAGHISLREITREQVLAALPPSRTAADQPGPTARRPAQQRCHPGGDRRDRRVLRSHCLPDGPAAAHRRPRWAAAPARPHRAAGRPSPAAAGRLPRLPGTDLAGHRQPAPVRPLPHRHPHRAGPGRLGHHPAGHVRPGHPRRPHPR